MPSSPAMPEFGLRAAHPDRPPTCRCPAVAALLMWSLVIGLT